MTLPIRSRAITPTFPMQESNAALLSRGAAIAVVPQTQKGFIVQLSSGAEIDVYPDEIEID